MKTTIKILLIVLVLAIIGTVIYLFWGKTPGENPPPPPPISEFEKHISERVNNEIKGKAHDKAEIAFTSILDEIRTEESLTDASGHPSITDAVAIKCRQMTFTAYAPLFVSYSDASFRSSVWPDSTLTFLNNRAAKLIDMRLAEPNSPIQQRLEKVQNTIKDYEAAWKLVRSASKSTSVSTVERIVTAVRNYQHAPLTNNSALAEALQNAPSEAKNSCANYIVRRCNQVANNWTTYSSYESFRLAFSEADRMIKEYENKYNRPSSFNDAIKKLIKADEMAVKELN